MYLKRRWRFGDGFSVYKVEKETACFYIVRINDKCTERVSKDKMASSLNWEWSVLTEEDAKIYKVRQLATKVMELVKKTDFRKWSEEKLEALISMIEQGECK